MAEKLFTMKQSQADSDALKTRAARAGMTVAGYVRAALDAYDGGSIPAPNLFPAVEGGGEAGAAQDAPVRTATPPHPQPIQGGGEAPGQTPAAPPDAAKAASAPPRPEPEVHLEGDPPPPLRPRGDPRDKPFKPVVAKPVHKHTPEKVGPVARCKCGAIRKLDGTWHLETRPEADIADEPPPVPPEADDEEW